MAGAGYSYEEGAFYGKCWASEYRILDDTRLLGTSNSLIQHIDLTISESENYGDSHQEGTVLLSEPILVQSTLRTVLKDRRILTLGLASCFFEGSMYLYVQSPLVMCLNLRVFSFLVPPSR